MNSKINPFIAGYVIVYILNLWLASTISGFPVEEVMGIMIVMGIGFSLLAHFTSRKAIPLDDPKQQQKNEGAVLTILVAYIAIIIIPGNKLISWLFPAAWLQMETTVEVITMVRKMLTLVVVPFVAYRLLFKFSARDFGMSPDLRKALTGKHLTIFLVMAFALAIFNYYAGSGARPLREGLASATQLLLGIPLLFLWDYLEVGLGEEFFFRGLLQNRLAVLLRNPWGAVFASALIFGLVHAPGMYLRGAGVIEGIGGAPSLLTCICYCIAVLSVPGIFFGILWMRTRNLWILMGIHAVTDLVPHLYGFILTWGI